MPINSRSKGAKGEREAAKVIAAWTKRTFAKTPASGGLSWKKANVAGDIVCTKEGHYFPFCVEVKTYSKIDFSHLLTPGIKNIEILDFWQQAVRDAKKVNKVPMLMMRYNGLPKGFFYVALPQLFYQKVRIKVGRTEKSMIFLWEEKEAIALLPSSDFFRLPYKNIKKLTKTYLEDGR